MFKDKLKARKEAETNKKHLMDELDEMKRRGHYNMDKLSSLGINVANIEGSNYDQTSLMQSPTRPDIISPKKTITPSLDLNMLQQRQDEEMIQHQ